MLVQYIWVLDVLEPGSRSDVSTFGNSDRKAREAVSHGGRVGLSRGKDTRLRIARLAA